MPQPMARHVFTYGSLMFAPVWQAVVRGRPAAMPARLRGFERLTVRDESFPAIVERPGASVEGVLYLDVADDDLRRLDAFEGPDYERRTLAVRVAEDRAGAWAAEAYVWRDRARLQARPWDAREFERNAMDSFLQTYCRPRGIDV